jgi:hypothetical protein
MKIRADLVTNSSSVSYVVTLDVDMAEFVKKKSKDFGGDARKQRIYGELVQDLKQQGQPLSVGEAQLLVRTYDFEKKKDCKYDASFDRPVDEVDFASLSDAEVWSYIYGEYFVRARLSAELKGFGAVQVPRDRAKLAAKYCDVLGCEGCERHHTPACRKSGQRTGAAAEPVTR